MPGRRRRRDPLLQRAPLALGALLAVEALDREAQVRAGRTRGSGSPGRAARAARRSRRAPAAPPSRSGRAPAGGRAPRSPRRAAGTPAGSRGPTRRRSAPRRPRTARCRPPTARRAPPGCASCSGARKRNSSVPSASSCSACSRSAALDRRVQLRRAARRDLAQRVDLVALERDQRRDDDGRARRQQPGDLVDRRLARAGRHDDQRVAPGERGLDRLPLPGPQLRDSRTPRARPARSSIRRPGALG